MMSASKICVVVVSGSLERLQMAAMVASVGAVSALFNFIVAFVVGKFTPEPPEHIQHLVENVRTPRGSRAVDGAHAY